MPRGLDIKFLILAGLSVLVLSFQNCSTHELNFPPPFPKSVTLKVMNYCPPEGHSFVELFATNRSAYLSNKVLIPDSDRDGLSDELERSEGFKAVYGFYSKKADTNFDYYSDYVQFALGVDKEQQGRLVSCPSGFNDTDLDGLTDCEENALKLDMLNPDSDGDSIPDGLEVRSKLNAADIFDADLDFDQDGKTNLEEIKQNTPMEYTNDKYTDHNALHYHTKTNFLDDGTSCYDLEVSNVPILDINYNLVQFYIVENYTDTSGTISEVIMTLQQVNFEVSRDVLDESEIVVEKDNNKEREIHTINND